MSAEAFAGLSPDEIENMRTALAKVRENVSRAENVQKGVA
jgi:hypothetical protein